MCKSVQTKGKICAKVENAEFAHPFTTFAQISPLVCTLLHMNKFDANPWGKLSSTITDSSTLVSFKNMIRKQTQHENGGLRKIKVCVNLRKVGHPTLRKLSTARKGL